MAKSTKIIAALGVAAGLGVAAMPLATFAAAGDDLGVTDTVKVTVEQSCTFKTSGNGSAADTTYTGNALQGAVVNFDNNGKHVFNVNCNNPTGFNVTAQASNLTSSMTAPHNTIDFQETGTYNAGGAGTDEDGYWTATVDTTGSTAAFTLTDQIETASAKEIVRKSSATVAAGSEFTVNYSAYVGTSTQAGTYSGTIVYTLSANS